MPSSVIPVNRERVEVAILQYLSKSDHSMEFLGNDPFVIKVFFKYSNALPSSTVVERLLSFTGPIHLPRRYTLSDKLFETLLIIKNFSGNSLYFISINELSAFTSSYDLNQNFLTIFGIH